MAPKAKATTKAAAKPAKATNVAKPTKPGTGSALKGSLFSLTPLKIFQPIKTAFKN